MGSLADFPTDGTVRSRWDSDAELAGARLRADQRLDLVGRVRRGRSQGRHPVGRRQVGVVRLVVRVDEAHRGQRPGADPGQRADLGDPARLPARQSKTTASSGMSALRSTKLFSAYTEANTPTPHEYT